MKLLRAAAALCALCVCAAGLSACGSEKVYPAYEPYAGGELTGLSGMDFSGLTVNILCRDELAKQLTGDIINDADFLRTEAVKERHNLRMSFVRTEDTASAIHESFLADDGAFDIYYGSASELSLAASRGHLADLRTAELLDLSRVWWAQSANDSLAVGGRLYTAAGDFAASLLRSVNVLYVNYAYIKEKGLDDPFAALDAGNWTLDAFGRSVKSAGDDINGADFDSVSPGAALEVSLGLHSVTAGEKLPSVKLDAKRAEGLSAFAKEFSGALTASDDLPPFAALHKNEYAEILERFEAEAPLYKAGYVAWWRYLCVGRNAEGKYELLPYPKYDEKVDYLAAPHIEATLMAFPADTPDGILSGIVAEAMCAEGYRNILPAVYADASMYYAAPKSEKSAGTLTLLRSRLEFSFAYTHLAAYLPADLLPADALINGRTVDAARAKLADTLKTVADMYKTIQN